MDNYECVICGSNKIGQAIGGDHVRYHCIVCGYEWKEKILSVKGDKNDND